MRYVIKFTKDSSIKFISHLDVMRTIHRVIRRSELPVEFSKGFNPHIILSIAQPLSVGVYSDGEYMDVSFKEELDENYLIEELNKHTALGIKFLWAKRVINKEGEKKLPQTMALIDASRFVVKICLKDTENIDEKIKNVLTQDSWTIIKKSKKGEKEVNIRPLLKELKYWVKDDALMLNVLVASGSREHLSPDLLCKYMSQQIDNIDTDKFIDIKREEMYIAKGAKYIPLFKSI